MKAQCRAGSVFLHLVQQKKKNAGTPIKYTSTCRLYIHKASKYFNMCVRHVNVPFNVVIQQVKVIKETLKKGSMKAN